MGYYLLQISIFLFFFLFWILAFFRLLKVKNGLVLFTKNILFFIAIFFTYNYFQTSEYNGDYGGLGNAVEILFITGLLSVFWSLVLLIYAFQKPTVNKIPVINQVLAFAYLLFIIIIIAIYYYK